MWYVPVIYCILLGCYKNKNIILLIIFMINFHVEHHENNVTFYMTRLNCTPGMIENIVEKEVVWEDD